MRRLLFFTAFLLLSCFFSKVASQDIILKKNGEKIKTKIVQVNDTLVKYKNFDDPEFVTFSMPSSEIKWIKYENGKRKIFGIDLAQSYISILGGFSNPVGDYSTNNSSNSDAGLAKTGRFISIDGCFYLKNKKWGIGFDLTAFNNSFNSSDIDNTLRRSLLPTETLITNYGKYSGGWLAVGPQYSSKINRWITWDIRYSLGIMRLTNPSMQYNYHERNFGVTYNSNGGSGTSLVRTFGTGLRFHLSKRLALKLFVQISTSNPTVKFTTDFTQTDSNGVIIFSQHNSPHKKLIRYNALNAGIGLTYQFGGDRIKPDNRNMYGRLPKSYFGVMIASSGPIARYGNNNFNNNNSGFAKHGTGFNIEACRYFKEKKWGIGFELAGFRNSFDQNSADQFLRNNSGFGSVNTSYGNYNGGWLSAGPQFSPKISRWVVWDLRASLGIMGLSKPSLHYIYNDASGSKVDYFLNSGLGLSLVKTVTTGFRFFLTDRLALRMFAQLAVSKPTVQYKAFLTETDSAGNIIISENSNHKKQVVYSTINTGIGLTYQFGKK
jgi:hypothetical protein